MTIPTATGKKGVSAWPELPVIVTSPFRIVKMSHESIQQASSMGGAKTYREHDDAAPIHYFTWDFSLWIHDNQMHPGESNPCPKCPSLEQSLIEVPMPESLLSELTTKGVNP